MWALVLLPVLHTTFVLSHPIRAPVYGIPKYEDSSLGLTRGRESPADPNHPIRLRGTDFDVLEARTARVVKAKWSGGTSVAMSREQARINQAERQLKESKAQMKRLKDNARTSYTQAEQRGANLWKT